MDINQKLQMSDESPFCIPWFGSGRSLRLYQGALCWAVEQGFSVQVECRSLKTSPEGRLLMGEFNHRALLEELYRRGFSPFGTEWGLLLELEHPRNLARERIWRDEQLRSLPAKRWRSSSSTKPYVQELPDSAHQVLNELLRWPVAELPPMQAIKAIRRWQARLEHLVPHRKGGTGDA